MPLQYVICQKIAVQLSSQCYVYAGDWEEEKTIVVLKKKIARRKGEQSKCANNLFCGCEGNLADCQMIRLYQLKIMLRVQGCKGQITCSIDTVIPSNSNMSVIYQNQMVDTCDFGKLHVNVVFLC